MTATTPTRNRRFRHSPAETAFLLISLFFVWLWILAHRDPFISQSLANPLWCSFRVFIEPDGQTHFVSPFDYDSEFGAIPGVRVAEFSFHHEVKRTGLFAGTEDVESITISMSAVDGRPTTPFLKNAIAAGAKTAIAEFSFAPGRFRHLNPVAGAQTLVSIRWFGWVESAAFLLLSFAACNSLRWIPITLRARRGQRRTLQGLCPNCAYPTKGLESSLCPECGHAFATSTSPS